MNLCAVLMFPYYQKEIDWEKVADDGVDFAMIRLGYRADRFREDCIQTVGFGKILKKRKRAGLSVGVYFFLPGSYDRRSSRRSKICDSKNQGKRY